MPSLFLLVDNQHDNRMGGPVRRGGGRGGRPRYSRGGRGGRGRGRGEVNPRSRLDEDSYDFDGDEPMPRGHRRL